MTIKIERIKISDAELKKVVEGAVRHCVANKATFSAYDITIGLRNAIGPAVEINHDRVKAMVHTYMRDTDEFSYGATDNGQYLIYAPVIVNDFKFVFGDGQTPVLGQLKSPWEDVYPDSTAIHKMSYNKASEELRILFISGNTECEYYDVPELVWFAFKDASSKGKFYHQHIKGKYNSNF